jgi:hypothetical protein
MPLPAQPLSVRRGNVIQVTSFDRRQEHLVRRIQVEVILLHKQRYSSGTAFCSSPAGDSASFFTALAASGRVIPGTVKGVTIA